MDNNAAPDRAAREEEALTVAIESPRSPRSASLADPRTPLEAVEQLAASLRIPAGLIALKRLREDPNDTELALRAALLLNAGSLARALTMFESTSEGREVLLAKPALDHQHVDLAELAKLPADTLGQAYSTFMTSRGLTAEVFVAPPEVHDPRLRYVSQRLRQTHDLSHVVTGYDTDVIGEIELQAFTYGQLRTPFAFVVALGGTLKARSGRMQTLRRVWSAYRRGRRAEPLCYRAWEQRFTTPLSDVRAELGL